MKQQSSGSQAVFEKYGCKSRRELFLEEMEQVVPWAALEALARPHYAKAAKGVNRWAANATSKWTG
jgi:transposase, IS5 family